MSSRNTIDEASRVVLSYSPADERIADGLDEHAFRSYLRKAHGGPVSLGDEWKEFVSCGCGSTKNVTLTLVSITGDEAIGEETEVEYEPAADDASSGNAVETDRS